MRWLNKLTAVGLIFLAAFAAHADVDEGDRVTPPQLELLAGGSLAATQLAGQPTAYLFWATWCPICRSELPVYQRLHDTYAARGFRVIAVSLDDDAEVARGFLREHGYTLPATLRDDALRAAFGPIKGTPTLFLVGRDGRVVLKHLGGIAADELEARIQSLR